MDRQMIVVMLAVFSSIITVLIVVLAASKKKRSEGGGQNPQRTYHGPTYPGSKRDRRDYGEEVPVHPHHETDRYVNVTQTRRKSPLKIFIVAGVLLVLGLIMFFILALFQ